MKIVSFNVNGLRARLHQLHQVIERHHPDIIGLQETKVHDDEFPITAIEELGYQVAFHGQKGHYGVALLYRNPPEIVNKGFATDTDDSQRRLISAIFPLPNGKKLHVYNGYFPQGESRSHPAKYPAKQQFYHDLFLDLDNNCNRNDQILVLGDMNIAPTDLDIGIGDDNRKRWLRTGKCCFLPEERQWLEKLFDWGLEDTFRSKNPNKNNAFSWFDYRSRGFEATPPRGLRIDLILANAALGDHCVGAGIDYDIRAMEKPSDHAPVWAEFGIK